MCFFLLSTFLFMSMLTCGDRFGFGVYKLVLCRWSYAWFCVSGFGCAAHSKVYSSQRLNRFRLLAHKNLELLVLIRILRSYMGCLSYIWEPSAFIGMYHYTWRDCFLWRLGRDRAQFLRCYTWDGLVVTTSSSADFQSALSGALKR